MQKYFDPPDAKMQKLNPIEGYLVEGEMLCPAIKDKLKTLISSQILTQGHQLGQDSFHL